MTRIVFRNDGKKFLTNTDKNSPKVGDFCKELKTENELQLAIKYINDIHNSKQHTTNNT